MISSPARLQLLFVLAVACILPSIAFSRPAPHPLTARPRPKINVSAATPPTVLATPISYRSSLPVQLLPAPTMGVALNRPFRSHGAFLSARFKRSMQIRRKQHRQEMANRRETYPLRFHSGLPSAKRYRSENPAAKPRKKQRPQRLAVGPAHNRHFVRFEGDILVVRERLLTSGAPNTALPIAHEIPFGASRRPYRVTVSGNRVIVFGSYPDVRSFNINTDGKLSESRGFSIGAAVSVVRGDEIAFAIAPPTPSRQSPRHVLHPLPKVHVIDGQNTVTTVSLVNGRDARGQRQGNLIVVGRCSFIAANPKRACTASTTLIPDASYQSSFVVGDSSALLHSGTSTYSLPWSGAPATLVPASQIKPASARLLSNGWLETKGQTVTVHRANGAILSRPFSEKIAQTVGLGQNLLVATEDSEQSVLAAYHLGKGFTPISGLAIPGRVIRVMQFHPTAPQSGYLIAQSTGQSGHDIQYLVIRVENLKLSLIHNSPIPPMAVSIEHGELIILLENTLVRL